MVSYPNPPEGHFNLLYFATASSYTDKDSEPLPAPLRLRDLFATLEERYAGFGKVLDTCMVTVNLDYVDPVADAEMVIREGDEVGILPPVSSG